jgi:hypothetical protein
MYMKHVLRAMAAAAIVGLSLTACRSPVPHMIWPQKDLEPVEHNDPSAPRRLLLASRASGFKAELVERLVAELRADGVYIRQIGVNQLRNAAANQYQAVVIVSTAMARTLDPKVTSFLEKVRDKSRVILLTTSSGGDWLPDEGPYDALAAASRMDDAPRIAAQAAQAVRRRLP